MVEHSEESVIYVGGIETENTASVLSSDLVDGRGVTRLGCTSESVAASSNCTPEVKLNSLMESRYSRANYGTGKLSAADGSLVARIVGRIVGKGEHMEFPSTRDLDSHLVYQGGKNLSRDQSSENSGLTDVAVEGIESISAADGKGDSQVSSVIDRGPNVEEGPAGDESTGEKVITTSNTRDSHQETLGEKNSGQIKNVGGDVVVKVPEAFMKLYADGRASNDVVVIGENSRTSASKETDTMEDFTDSTVQLHAAPVVGNEEPGNLDAGRAVQGKTLNKEAISPTETQSGEQAIFLGSSEVPDRDCKVFVDEEFFKVREGGLDNPAEVNVGGFQSSKAVQSASDPEDMHAIQNYINEDQGYKEGTTLETEAVVHGGHLEGEGTTGIVEQKAHHMSPNVVGHVTCDNGIQKAAEEKDSTVMETMTQPLDIEQDKCCTENGAKRTREYVGENPDLLCEKGIQEAGKEGDFSVTEMKAQHFDMEPDINCPLEKGTRQRREYENETLDLLRGNAIQETGKGREFLVTEIKTRHLDIERDKSCPVGLSEKATRQTRECNGETLDFFCWNETQEGCREEMLAVTEMKAQHLDMERGNNCLLGLSEKGTVQSREYEGETPDLSCGNEIQEASKGDFHVTEMEAQHLDEEQDKSCSLGLPEKGAGGTSEYEGDTPDLFCGNGIEEAGKEGDLPVIEMKAQNLDMEQDKNCPLSLSENGTQQTREYEGDALDLFCRNGMQEAGKEGHLAVAERKAKHLDMEGDLDYPLGLSEKGTVRTREYEGETLDLLCGNEIQETGKVGDLHVTEMNAQLLDMEQENNCPLGFSDKGTRQTTEYEGETLNLFSGNGIQEAGKEGNFPVTEIRSRHLDVEQDKNCPLGVSEKKTKQTGECLCEFLGGVVETKSTEGDTVADKFKLESVPTLLRNSKTVQDSPERKNNAKPEDTEDTAQAKEFKLDSIPTFFSNPEVVQDQPNSSDMNNTAKPEKSKIENPAKRECSDEVYQDLLSNGIENQMNEIMIANQHETIFFSSCTELESRDQLPGMPLAEHALPRDVTLASVNEMEIKRVCTEVEDAVSEVQILEKELAAADKGMGSTVESALHLSKEMMEKGKLRTICVSDDAIKAGGDAHTTLKEAFAERNVQGTPSNDRTNVLLKEGATRTNSTASRAASVEACVSSIRKEVSPTTGYVQSSDAGIAIKSGSPKTAAERNCEEVSERVLFSEHGKIVKEDPVSLSLVDAGQDLEVHAVLSNTAKIEELVAGLNVQVGSVMEAVDSRQACEVKAVLIDSATTSVLVAVNKPPTMDKVGQVNILDAVSEYIPEHVGISVKNHTDHDSQASFRIAGSKEAALDAAGNSEVVFLPGKAHFTAGGQENDVKEGDDCQGIQTNKSIPEGSGLRCFCGALAVLKVVGQNSPYRGLRYWSCEVFKPNVFTKKRDRTQADDEKPSCRFFQWVDSPRLSSEQKKEAKLDKQCQLEHLITKSQANYSTRSGTKQEVTCSDSKQNGGMSLWGVSPNSTMSTMYSKEEDWQRQSKKQKHDGIELSLSTADSIAHSTRASARKRKANVLTEEIYHASPPSSLCLEDSSHEACFENSHAGERKYSKRLKSEVTTKEVQLDSAKAAINKYSAKDVQKMERATADTNEVLKLMPVALAYEKSIEVSVEPSESEDTEDSGGDPRPSEGHCLESQGATLAQKTKLSGRPKQLLKPGAMSPHHTKDSRKLAAKTENAQKIRKKNVIAAPVTVSLIPSYSAGSRAILNSKDAHWVDVPLRSPYGNFSGSRAGRVEKDMFECGATWSLEGTEVLYPAPVVSQSSRKVESGLANNSRCTDLKKPQHKCAISVPNAWAQRKVDGKQGTSAEYSKSVDSKDIKLHCRARSTRSIRTFLKDNGADKGDMKEYDPPICDCKTIKRFAVLKTVLSKNGNQGRRYWVCVNHKPLFQKKQKKKEESCRFFQWLDTPRVPYHERKQKQLIKNELGSRKRKICGDESSF